MWQAGLKPGEQQATASGVTDGTTDRDAIPEWWGNYAIASIGFGDENAAREVGELLGALDAIRYATSCVILLVHHVRKTGEIGQAQGGFDSVRRSSRLISDPQSCCFASDRMAVTPQPRRSIWSLS